MAATFADYLPALLPTFLRGPWGRRWGAAHGAACDAVLDGAKDAVRAGFGPSAPTDALPLLLADAGLEGLPGETSAEQRARIAAVFDLWSLAGTKPGLDLALGQLGFSGYVLRTTRGWLPDAPPDGLTSRWARWWCLVPDTAHPYTLDNWDDPGNWDDGGVWDIDASIDEVGRWRRHLRAQMGARDVGYLRLFFDDDGDVWGPDTPFDSGVWADDAATFTDLEI